MLLKIFVKWMFADVINYTINKDTETNSFQNFLLSDSKKWTKPCRQIQRSIAIWSS